VAVFSTSTDERDGLVLVAVSGELDVANTSELETLLDRYCVAPQPRVVVDMSNLTFIDSSGLNLLALTARTVASLGGSFVVAGPPDHITHVFEVVHLESEVQVAPSLEDALERLAGESGR
jgi:stage II sporulation protein AA (anti-sigma F factor antagonist)